LRVQQSSPQVTRRGGPAVAQLCLVRPKAMRFVFITMAVVGVPASAIAREALLQDGVSPDKRLGAYLVSADQPKAAAADFPAVVVRREQDHRVLGCFASSSYMAYFDPAYERTKVAWSPDSRFLAVLSRGTKTTYEVAVYHAVADSVVPVSLPDYRRLLFARLGIATGGRHLLLSEPAWLDHTLRVHDTASNPTDFPDDWYECTTIVFRVEPAKKPAVEEIIVHKSPKRPNQTTQPTDWPACALASLYENTLIANHAHSLQRWLILLTHSLPLVRP